MKKLIFFLIFILLLIPIGIWSPWRNFNIDISALFGVEAPEKISGLQVFSLNGEIEVYLNNQIQGKVNVEDSPLIIDQIVPGNQLVTLKKVSLNDGEYWDFNEIINFNEGTAVVIAYNLGPSKEFSEGHVISTVKNENNEINNLKIKTNINDAIVRVDGITLDEFNSTFSHQIDLENQHTLSVSKPGFEPLEFTILPDSEDERKKFEGFIIEIEAQLMYQPILVEESLT